MQLYFIIYIYIYIPDQVTIIPCMVPTTLSCLGCHVHTTTHLHQATCLSPIPVLPPWLILIALLRKTRTLHRVGCLIHLHAHCPGNNRCVLVHDDALAFFKKLGKCSKETTDDP